MTPPPGRRWRFFFLYNGLHATIYYRISHWLYHHCRFLARWVSQHAKWVTGVEIHPAAMAAAWSLTTAPALWWGLRRNWRRLPAVPVRDPGRHRHFQREAAPHPGERCDGGQRRKILGPIRNWGSCPCGGQRRGAAKCAGQFHSGGRPAGWSGSTEKNWTMSTPRTPLPWSFRSSGSGWSSWKHSYKGRSF